MMPYKQVWPFPEQNRSFLRISVPNMEESYHEKSRRNVSWKIRRAASWELRANPWKIRVVADHNYG